MGFDQTTIINKSIRCEKENEHKNQIIERKQVKQKEKQANKQINEQTDRQTDLQINEKEKKSKKGDENSLVMFTYLPFRQKC